MNVNVVVLVVGVWLLGAGVASAHVSIPSSADDPDICLACDDPPTLVEVPDGMTVLPSPCGAVIAAERAPRYYWYSRPERFWTPRERDIRRLEKRVGPWLRAHAGPAPDLWKRLPTYRRQYVGVVEHGRPKIAVYFPNGRA